MGVHEVVEALTPLIVQSGAPEHLRSELAAVAPPVRATAGDGSEFIPEPLQIWLRRVDIEPIRILQGSTWENGYNKRFNGTLRQEELNAEWLETARQAQTVIKAWLRQYNRIRPHEALERRPPAPETI